MFNSYPDQSLSPGMKIPKVKWDYYEYKLREIKATTNTCSERGKQVLTLRIGLFIVTHKFLLEGRPLIIATFLESKSPYHSLNDNSKFTAARAQNYIPHDITREQENSLTRVITDTATVSLTRK